MPLALKRSGGRGVDYVAKAWIQDRKAYAPSLVALTGAALNRSLDAGLLVRGGSLPGRVERHFDESIDSGQRRALRG